MKVLLSCVLSLCCIGAQGAPVDAVEYYHAAFNHYFFTINPDEQNALDAGKFQGWARTGKSFKLENANVPVTSPLCRFFSASFAPLSSHFYTAIVSECNVVRTSMPAWQYEGIVAYVSLPNTSTGACASGSKLYRLYNNGQGGAPNHRYTTDLAIRQTMMSQGWIPEGFGAEGVVGCTPTVATPFDTAFAKTSQLLGGTWTFTYTSGTSTYQDPMQFTDIVSATTLGQASSDTPWFAVGVNRSGVLSLGAWVNSLGVVLVFSPRSSGATYPADSYYFDYTGSDTAAGCYTLFLTPQSQATCSPLTGSRR